MFKALFGGGVPHLSVEEYRAQFNGNGSHFLLDVRSPEEFQSGHVPGAKNIPLNVLTSQVGGLPADKPIVVVCRSGNRSRMGAIMLQQAGIESVYNLSGGTQAWQRADLPLNR